MIWKCPCGEVNVGAAKECRKCGVAFSDDLIVKKQSKSAAQGKDHSAASETGQAGKQERTSIKKLNPSPSPKKVFMLKLVKRLLQVFFILVFGYLFSFYGKLVLEYCNLKSTAIRIEKYNKDKQACDQNIFRIKNLCSEYLIRFNKPAEQYSELESLKPGATFQCPARGQYQIKRDGKRTEIICSFHHDYANFPRYPARFQAYRSLPAPTLSFIWPMLFNLTLAAILAFLCIGLELFQDPAEEAIPRRNNGWKLPLILMVLTLAVPTMLTFLSLLTPWMELFPDRLAHKKIAKECRAYIRTVESCLEMYLMEHAAVMVPEKMDDISMYICSQRLPVCPTGADYRIKATGEGAFFVYCPVHGDVSGNHPPKSVSDNALINALYDWELGKEFSYPGYEQAKKLIVESQDIDQPDASGRTPLMLAIIFGKPDLAAMLIERTDLNRRDMDNYFALTYAVKKGYLDLAEQMIAKGADPVAFDQSAESLLLIAIENGARDFAGRLLDRGAAANGRGGYGYTALMHAARQNWPDMVERLLGLGAPLEAENDGGSTALQVACTSRAFAAARTLADHGADINHRNREGDTALMLSLGSRYGARAEKAGLEFAGFLIGKGADINCQGKYGSTPLLDALHYGYREIADMLLAAGANQKKTGKDQDVALLYAAGSGFADIVERLATEGYDLNVRDYNQRTPLIAAAGSGHAETAKVLIAKGADIGLSCEDRMTPLILALHRGYIETAAALKTAGADFEKEYAEYTKKRRQGK
ncbi:MAG: ankyrin repeat domain-containing protein [Candidatus Wallbacteria bacterium]|nr:ankyrin repeat domain-containing protein [Candidatus Wallbacteria bacterium]